MIRNFSFIIALSLMFNVSFASKAPDTFLKDSVQEISQLVSKYKDKLESDEAFLREKMNSIVMPKLDITLMSKIILGKKIWKSMSSVEQDRFVQAFKYRMVSTYMKSLSAFDGEKIEFLPYTPGKRESLAFVKSKYIIASGNVSVDYRLIRTKSGWKVYDIIFDGISLMKNYRVDYRDHVDKKGIESLISELKSS